MTTNTEALTYDHIVALALENGFKLKPQVDGRMALNDYVIDFARAVYDIGRAAAKAEPAAAVAAERDYWRNELHALLEAADAVATNNAHAVSIGSVRYAKHSQTWKAYASLDRARQRASDAIRAGAKEPSDG